ncbi:MAG: ribonuclease P protein component [Candidatus Magasanikbacteria bacterium CG10_big_fil_rev_8_21_14_0_10_36_32]|uniref:Ribonuclease P protein component n=1 Tax=Candidatus Magasanikbacteria bacterium CG10_big_fil_rev_8_21_14_0_10_36_32 TaxID=1974646 RepID=A0A2M6W6Y6_9BACT|nr:MAG: ribonuclease P protein component [Candidatus Magasanikbacteria bacterium CG10_big_fil_rev_8_21_14_0_10_36_32]
MLKLDNRLTKVRDFNLVMKYGHWINGIFLDMKVLELSKNESYFPKKEDVENFKKQFRLAINISLKVSKKAVLRNKLRRQISEVIRLLIKENLIKVGFYVLIVAKKDILKKDYTEIDKEVNFLLSKAKLLK